MLANIAALGTLGFGIAATSTSIRGYLLDHILWSADTREARKLPRDVYVALLSAISRRLGIAASMVSMEGEFLGLVVGEDDEGREGRLAVRQDVNGQLGIASVDEVIHWIRKNQQDFYKRVIVSNRALELRACLMIVNGVRCPGRLVVEGAGQVELSREVGRGSKR